MAFCSNCGTEIQDGVKFCQSCGAGVNAEASAQEQPQEQQDYTPPIVPGSPTMDDVRDAQDNKVMAIIAYILFFIPLLTGDYKKSPFVKYHTNQGTVLFLASLAFGIVYGILFAILSAIFVATLFVGGLVIFGVITTILSLLWLIPAIFCILGIINAAGGNMKPLPLIGNITIIK